MRPPAHAARTALAAVALSLAAAGLAHAQGADPLGTSEAADWLVLLVRAAGAVVVVWGLVRALDGRHAVEGWLTVAVGALVVVKATPILHYLWTY